MPRLVCEHCGYDLSGTRMHNEQYQCPECGKASKPWARDGFPSWWFGSVGLCALAQLFVLGAVAVIDASSGRGQGTGTAGMVMGFPLVGAAMSAYLWHRSHRMVRRTLIWSIGVFCGSFVACIFTLVVVGYMTMFLRDW